MIESISRKYQRRKRPKERKKDFDPNRRKFLKFSIFFSVGALVVGILPFIFRKRPEEDKKISLSLKELLEKIDNYLKKIEDYNSFNPNQKIEIILDEELKKFIETNNLNSLMKRYFNIIEKNEDSKKKIEINPYEVLDSLWEIKIELVEDNKKEFFKKLKSEILENYQNKPGEKINITKFFEYLEYCLGQALLLIDIEKLLEKFNFSDNEKKLLELILNDKEFLEYLELTLIVIIINEISFCSEQNPEINIKLLEYLISNFGINFITCIPAIYDKRISFGPFQLTDIVIGENTETATYPITKINECLKDEFKDYKLPNKLEEFKNRYHYIGEIFLCLYFLCRYIKKLKDQQIPELIDIIQNNPKKKVEFYDNLIMMFCACHYGGESNLDQFLKPKNERKFKENIEKYLKRAETTLNYLLNLI